MTITTLSLDKRFCPDDTCLFEFQLEGQGDRLFTNRIESLFYDHIAAEPGISHIKYVFLPDQSAAAIGIFIAFNVALMGLPMATAFANDGSATKYKTSWIDSRQIYNNAAGQRNTLPTDAPGDNDLIIINATSKPLEKLSGLPEDLCTLNQRVINIDCDDDVAQGIIASGVNPSKARAMSHPPLLLPSEYTIESIMLAITLYGLFETWPAPCRLTHDQKEVVITEVMDVDALRTVGLLARSEWGNGVRSWSQKIHYALDNFPEF